MIRTFRAALKFPQRLELATPSRVWRAVIVSDRHPIKQAFIKSPAFKFRLIEVIRISDGILILQALGEGSLLVCDRKRPATGYYNMAEVDLTELTGKSEAEVMELLNRRMEKVKKAERSRTTPRGNPAA